jgi:DNA-binding NtrC family response regulator
MASLVVNARTPDVSTSLRILIIDDDADHTELVKTSLQSRSVEIFSTTDPEAGMELFRSTRPHVVLLDLVMPKINGIEMLEQIVELDPAANVILITAHYSPESAVQAIQKGACDYLTKPLDIKKLRARVDSILADAETRRRTHRLESELLEAYDFQGIVGRSPLMLEVFAMIRRVAPHFRTVLIRGDTGTGKELVAHALHRLSPVAQNRFATCNCSALMESLMESELFGYVRGAFTGAVQDKQGLFEHANGGTVFLDEVGELSLSAQAKLLRVLQTHEIQRVGSPISHRVDIRVIAATNRDLRARVQAGRFREDLYYRLAVVEIKVPRLADRREDLPLLERHLINRFANRYNKEVSGMTRRAQAVLTRHYWPGNVRELENVIGHACMMAQSPVIDIQDLPDTVLKQSPDVTPEVERLLPMEEVQTRHLVKVLEHVNGNKSQAAEILGLSRATVYEMLTRIKTQESKRKSG